MRFTRAKILMLLFFLLLSYFFSNDFGLIDIEKTAIVTAVGIDKSDLGEFEVTLQIAVPESNNQTSSNTKAVLSGNGKTVAEAISKIGETSGWYPKLSFCNLILLGKNLLSTDGMTAVDYFIRTIKIQDSALLAGTFERANSIMKQATPLDNISSFALQKILLKKPGMTKNILSTDIKEFALGYYSRTSSNFFPIIEKIETENNQSSNTSSSDNKQSGGEQEKSVLFDARKTALVKNGKVIDFFTAEETQAVIFCYEKVKDSSLPVTGVTINDNQTDFLLNVIDSNYSIKTSVIDNKPNLNVKISIFVKIADETDKSTALGHLPFIIVPEEVLKKAKENLENNILSAIEKCKNAKCDFFNIDLKLYRFFNKEYKKLNGNIFDNLSYSVTVDIFGQK